jgi:6-phosphogluconate dehydrogenase
MIKVIAIAYRYWDYWTWCFGSKSSAKYCVFIKWNEGELNSHLIQITADVLGKIDEETGLSLIDVILDTAHQKGTGKWTS